MKCTYIVPTMLDELCKQMKHSCAALQSSWTKRYVMSCSMLAQKCDHNMQQDVQTDATS